MSSTHFIPAGAADVYHTDAACMDGEETVPWMNEGDIEYCEEGHPSDGEAVADEEVSSDEESEPSASSMDEDDVEEEEEGRDSEEGGEDEQYAESNVEDEEAEDEEWSQHDEEYQHRDYDQSAIEDSEEERDSVMSGESSEDNEEGCYLGSDDEVESALASQYSEQHEGSQDIESGEHLQAYLHNATAVRVNSSDELFDMSQVAVQRETTSYIEHGDIDYSNHNGGNYEHQSEYTCPQYTTYAEATTYEETIVKKPGMIRRFTDKAKANMKDEEKRRKALHIIQTGAQFTRFGRVVTEVQTSGPEIMHARATGKKAVGKKVAKAAVKVAVKALL
jgi:hypothetical protein